MTFTFSTKIVTYIYLMAAFIQGQLLLSWSDRTFAFIHMKNVYDLTNKIINKGEIQILS